MAVLGGAAIVAGAWVVFTAFGMVCIALLPSATHRAEVTPAAPAIGMLGLVVVLYATSIALPVPPGVAIAVTLALGGLLHPTVRARLRHPGRRALGTLALCGLLGAPVAGIALLPLRHDARPTVVQPTPNNDAYAFVTEADWLLHHNGIEEPARATIPVGYQYVRRHADHGLRIGPELVIDTVATLSRQPVDELYFPLTVLWVALIPGVVVAAGGILGMRRCTALPAGAMLSLGSLEAYQLLNENSAAALGVVVVPLALAAVADALDLLPGRTRLPLLVAPLVLAGVVGSYAEYAPLLLPVFALIVVLRRPVAIPCAVQRLATVLALSVVVSPFAWWHAVTGTLLHLGDPFLGWVSPFLTATSQQFAVRWIGGGDLVNFGVDHSRLALLVFAVAVAGIALAVALAPRRRVWGALLLASALLITYVSTVRRIAYSEQRAILYTQPLLLLAAAAGFDALVHRLSTLRDRTWRDLTAVGVAVTAALFAVVNVDADLRLARPDAGTLAHRTLDGDFSDAATWAQQYGGARSADLLVVDGDYFDQLWLAYTLRDQTAAAWATFEPGYVDIGACRYLGPSPLWDGVSRPYVLADRLSVLTADPGSVVAEDSRFVLLRTGGGRVVVTTAPQVVAGHPGEISVDGPTDMLVLAFGGASPDVRVLAITGSNRGTAAVVLRVGVAGQTVRDVATSPGRAVSLPVNLIGIATRVEVVPEQPASGGDVVLDRGRQVRPTDTTQPDAGPPLQAPCD